MKTCWEKCKYCILRILFSFVELFKYSFGHMNRSQKTAFKEYLKEDYLKMNINLSVKSKQFND